MGIHDGHRERLRGRFIKHGLESFNELNALELLLFYAIPRKDTNVIAHNLLDTFGSLSNVFDASHQELMAVDGIGETAASLIRLVPQIMKCAAMNEAQRRVSIPDIKAAANFLKPYFMSARDELFVVLCLDARNNVICCEVMSKGVVNSVEVNIRRVLETVIKAKASSIVIAHNHPDGNPMPSMEDDATTKQLYITMSSLGIEVFDHIVFGGEQYFSYREMGHLSLIKNYR